MNQIFVKPAQGRTVKLPGVPKHRNTVPSDGILVEHDTFIERRLRHGDLVLADAPAKSAAPSAKGSAA